MSNRNKLLDEERARLARATAEFSLAQTILGALPSELDVEIESLYPHGAYADATLQFNGAEHLPHLLKVLTPVPCLLVNDGCTSVRPAVSLKSTENCKTRESFPVIVVFPNGDRGKAVWWTTIADKLVTVHVHGVGGLNDVTPFIDLKVMSPGSLTYATGRSAYWTRKMKTHPDEVKTSPLQLWDKKWEDWKTEHRYTALQQIFANGVKALISASFPDSPSMARVELPSTPEEAAKGWWGRAGNFFAAFTTEEAKTLQDFALEQSKKLPGIAEEANLTLRKAEEWFKAFFEVRGVPGTIPQDLIRYLFHKEMGLPGSVNWVQYYTKANSYSERVEVQYMVDKVVARFDCGINPEAPPIKWDDLYEYY